MASNSISVIIPAYNSEQTLAACLEALQRQTCPPAEIIVVDDGSTDHTRLVAGQGGVVVLSQAQAGPAAARNRGARAANGDILLFTDADCVPAADWIERMVSALADATVAGAKGIYRTRQPELMARFVQQEYQDRYDRMVGQPWIDFVDTYSAAYRRRLFLKAGGFDPAFRLNEDQEFSFRLTAQGHRLVFVPDAVVYHRHRSTVGAYASRKYLIGYWKALITRRYPSKLIRDSHTPQSLKLQMGLAALGGVFLASGAMMKKRPLAVAGWGSWMLLLLSGGQLYAKIVRRDPSVLIVAPFLLFVRAWALGVGFLVGTLRIMVQQQ